MAAYPDPRCRVCGSETDSCPGDCLEFEAAEDSLDDDDYDGALGAYGEDS